MTQPTVSAEIITSAALRPPVDRTSDLYGWTCDNVLSPAWERFVKRRPTRRHLDILERTQWLSKDEIESFQLRELRALLAHAQANVPYYRELFARLRFDARDVTRREDLASLPLLTKDIIRERYHDLVSPAHRGRNLKKGTSGSTGTPLKFEYCPESYAWREATKIRGYRWGGYNMGSPTFHYWAQVYATPQGAAGLKLRLDRALKRETFVDSMRNDERSMREAVELFRRAAPSCMIVYTQSCAMWARFILDQGLRDWPDVPVLCGAEAVLPQDRAVLARAFGPEIFETYGSRETMLLASECRAHDGMHLSEENLVVEVVDASGRPLGAGGTGDVVVTDLHNFGMPFIRYANGDVATMHDDAPCSCGRGLRRLRRVDGRRADTLLDFEGRPIPGIVFHVLFSDSRKEIVAQFRVVQHTDRSITFHVVRGQDWEQGAFDAVVARIRGYLRGLPMEIAFADAIRPTASGKHKTIMVERAAPPECDSLAE
jgi:phenylacetate-CoA ligase